MKKRSSKKGFGLVAAMLIIFLLTIMAAGFLTVTDYSRKSVETNIRDLRLYWAAESASNYNVNNWVNIPEEQRLEWNTTPYTYSAKTSYNDIDGPQATTSDFPGAAGITDGNVIYLHRSSLTIGNTGLTNPELQDLNGNKLLLARYKGPRKGDPTEAVWILDSYAWDPKTGDIANIVLANVYNEIVPPGLGPFQNGELINETIANSGFHGCKGRFNEQDVRFGDCYFGGLVHFDYKTGAVKYGPTFYGLVKSAATVQSWYKSEGTYFPGTSMYSHGLGINKNVTAAQADATALASLKGGYQKLAEPLDLSTVTWDWADVVAHGPAKGIYFLEPAVFGTSGDINVKVRTVVVGGDTTTVADIYKCNATNPPVGSPLKTISIGNSGFKGIAVKESYGEVGISGVSADDFSLITQSDRVNIVDDFYLSEMTATKTWVKAAVLAQGTGNGSTPPPVLPYTQLKMISDQMLSYSPKGHLAVVAALDAVASTDKTWPPIYIPENKIIFSTSSYITQWGELGAKGTGPTALRFYNVGAIMTLEKQTIASGPSDTAQKWPKVFIEDERYSRPNEPLPPYCGAGPSVGEGDNQTGLNKQHIWSQPLVTRTDDWRTVVWRNLSSYPQ